MQYDSNSREVEEVTSDEDGVIRNKKVMKRKSIKKGHIVTPIRPGVNSYRDAVVEGKKAVVFSTSMTRSIRINEFNSYYKEGNARFFRFHGAKARHVKDYVLSHLEEEQPDSVIIQMGGNDLPTGRPKP